MATNTQVAAKLNKKNTLSLSLGTLKKWQY